VEDIMAGGLPHKLCWFVVCLFAVVDVVKMELFLLDEILILRPYKNVFG
jgi:hypothetical protein